MDREALDEMAPLYDEWAHSLDPLSDPAREAQEQFMALLRRHHQDDLHVPFEDYRRGVIMACREWLKRN